MKRHSTAITLLAACSWSQFVATSYPFGHPSFDYMELTTAWPYIRIKVPTNISDNALPCVKVKLLMLCHLFLRFSRILRSGCDQRYALCTLRRMEESSFGYQPGSATRSFFPLPAFVFLMSGLFS